MSVRVVVKEMVHPAVLLVSDNRREIDIFHTAEDVFLNVRVGLLYLGYQLLDLHAFGGRGAVRSAGRAGIREAAGALYEMQPVIITPVHDILLAYEIHRAYELHALKISAVELWHHGLNLTAVEHAHEYSLYHVIKMMSECDLVAA